MEMSSTSMKVASDTMDAMSQGLRPPAAERSSLHCPASALATATVSGL